MRHLITTLCLCLACSFSSFASNFITTDGNRLIRNGAPYFYVGTNFWYGPILGSKGQGGNRDRLAYELDSLKSMGVDNLRILVGAERGSKFANSVRPVLQATPGVLNDTLLDGLDYLLAEMSKRQMVAVLYLTNSWDWSGGYGFYLRETGHGDSPSAEGAEGYDAYCRYAAKMNSDVKAQELFFKYVKAVIPRTNKYTGKKYTEDPTIMAWQIANEPRPFAVDQFDNMVKFLSRTTRLIKSLDKNHLVSLGSEGIVGCENNEQVCERIVMDKNVDYMTVHIWPKNWNWTSNDRLTEALPNVYLKAKDYINRNTRIASKANKPVVIEEFGYPRDHAFYSAGTTVSARDNFYNFIFQQLINSKENGGNIVGCNFWGWGGKGRFSGKRWKAGDDFLCDPPHEPQGWYSVYDSDTTTTKLIKETAKQLCR